MPTYHYCQTTEPHLQHELTRDIYCPGVLETAELRMWLDEKANLKISMELVEGNILEASIRSRRPV